MRNPWTPQERAAPGRWARFGGLDSWSQGPELQVIAEAIRAAAVEEHVLGMADAYENAAVLASMFQGSAQDFAAILREHGRGHPSAAPRADVEGARAWLSPRRGRG